MDFKFEHEIEIGGRCAATIEGRAVIDGTDVAFSVESIFIDTARYEYTSDGYKSVWREAELEATHCLHREVLNYLETERRGDIQLALYNAGHRGYVVDDAVEHRTHAGVL